MKHTSKPSVAPVTNSNQKSRFRVATLRLTAYYTAGITIVLILFSFLVYGLFTNSIRQTADHDESLEQFHEESRYDELTENLLTILVVSDIVLFFLSILVSYYISRKTLAPIEDAYHKQERFVSDAAHELRTPLAVMKAGAEVMLSKERSPSEYQKFAQESLGETERLIRLSNDLLLLAKQDSQAAVICKEISLSAILQNTVDSIASYAVARQVHIESSIESGVSIVGDQDSIIRLAYNLIKNAIDYNVADGSVTVSLIHRDKKAVLIIQDTGIGISAQDLPHIFDRFYRADSSRSSRDSSGLGLSIAKEIVDVHAGSIHIESVAGKGTKVMVAFPFV